MIQTLLHSSCVILGTNEARLFKTASRQNAKTKRLAAWIAIRILNLPSHEIANQLGYVDRDSLNKTCRIVDEYIKQRNFEIIELIYHICNHSNTIPKNYGGTYSPSTWLKTLLQFIPLGHENMRRTRGKTSQTATTATKQHSSVTSSNTKKEKPSTSKAGFPTLHTQHGTHSSFYTSQDRDLAIRLTMENTYLDTKEERELYYSALCHALAWGRKCDFENQKRMKELRNLPNTVYVSMID
jgi:hypothetical protein